MEDSDDENESDKKLAPTLLEVNKSLHRLPQIEIESKRNSLILSIPRVKTSNLTSWNWKRLEFAQTIDKALPQSRNEARWNIFSQHGIRDKTKYIVGKASMRTLIEQKTFDR